MPLPSIAPLLPTHLRAYENRGLWRGRTIAEAARELAERAPECELLLAGGATYTAERLYGDAEALATALGSLGVTPGTVVSFQLPNWPEAAVINVACAMLGAVITPIVPIYRDAEVGQMLRDSRSRVHLATESFRSFDYAAMLDRLAEGLPDLQHIVFVRGERGKDSYSALLDAGRNQRPKLPRIDPSAVKLLLYTSGTTGPAKGVLHNHDTLARSIVTVAAHWNIGSGDALLMPSPVTHITGYSTGLEMPFLVGSRTVLMEAWNAAEAAQLIDRYRIVGTVLATPFLQELIAVAERTGERLPSIGFFACGGAPVPPELVRRANNTFARTCVFRVYGASEVPLVTFGYLGTANAELAATTDGEIIDYEVRIVGDDGAELPRGVAGEILARGPAMFLGYADTSQTAAAITSDGFFRTGDIGIVTSRGSLIVTGRKKDLIIRGGENISPKEIEDVLHKHPGISEAAVVAMPHPRLGEGVCAYLVARSGFALDLESVSAHVLGQGLARQKCPEHIVIVPALPKTASGKVRKDLLRAEVRAQLKRDQHRRP